jgi:hypothetical protein
MAFTMKSIEVSRTPQFRQSGVIFSRLVVDWRSRVEPHQRGTPAVGRLRRGLGSRQYASADLDSHLSRTHLRFR